MSITNAHDFLLGAGFGIFVLIASFSGLGYAWKTDREKKESKP